MNMDRSIFDLNLSTEATSLYILICSFLDQGQAPTLESLRPYWNNDDQSLVNAGRELIQRHVVKGKEALSSDTPIELTPKDCWIKQQNPRV